MSRAFAVIPAKPTFGTLNDVIYQSDYLALKKAKICCKGAESPYVCSKNDLVVGQYLKMNLNGVNTVSSNCEDTSVHIIANDKTPFYDNNTIDPYGELFGNTQYGELNYIRYLQFAPTENYKTLANYKRICELSHKQNNCDNKEDKLLNEIYSEIVNINTILINTIQDVNILKNEVGQTNITLDAIKNDVTTMNKGISDAREAIGTTNNALEATKHDVTTMNKGISDAREAIGTTNDVLEATKRDVTTMKNGISDAREAIGTTNNALEATKHDITTMKNGISDAREAIGTTNNALEATKRDITNIINTADSDRATNNSTQSTSIQNIATLNSQLNELNQTINNIASNDVSSSAVQQKHIDWIYMQIYHDKPNNMVQKYPQPPYPDGD